VPVTARNPHHAAADPGRYLRGERYFFGPGCQEYLRAGGIRSEFLCQVPTGHWVTTGRFEAPAIAASTNVDMICMSLFLSIARWNMFGCP